MRLKYPFGGQDLQKVLVGTFWLKNVHSIVSSFTGEHEEIIRESAVVPL